MNDRPRHHKPLDKRFAARLSTEAYAVLRELADATGLGNNYVRTVLLEDHRKTIDRAAFLQAACDMLERHKKE